MSSDAYFVILNQWISLNGSGKEEKWLCKKMEKN